MAELCKDVKQQQQLSSVPKEIYVKKLTTCCCALLTNSEVGSRGHSQTLLTSLYPFCHSEVAAASAVHVIHRKFFRKGLLKAFLGNILHDFEYMPK